MHRDTCVPQSQGSLLIGINLKHAGVWVVLFCVWLLVGCGDAGVGRQSQSRANQPVVLARVGDGEITLAQFEAELARRSRGGSNSFATEAGRKKLLEEMIRFEVLLAGAKAAGYDRDPRIQSSINEFIVSRFQEDRLASGGSVTLGEDDLRAYYASNQMQFTDAPAVRAALIQFKISPKASEEKRAELRAKAQAIWSEAGDGDEAAFARLAQQHSEDQSTRYHGGETGWVTAPAFSQRWNVSLSEAAFALTTPGQTAPLVETPDSFYIVRLLEKRPQTVRPLQEVRAVIQYELGQRKEFERQAALEEQLKRNLRIETYPERLPTVTTTAQAAEPTPPAVPKS